MLKPCRKGLHSYDREKASQCLECKKIRRVSEEGKKKSTQEAKQWRAANMAHVRNYRNSYKTYSRRLRRLRTPKWANKSEIEKFYLNCPAGYEVDHIIPFKGKTVSGLHVHNNLQYLTPSQNRVKGNRL